MTGEAHHCFGSPASVPEGREKLAGGKALRRHPRLPPSQRPRPGGGVSSVPLDAQ